MRRKSTQVFALNSVQGKVFLKSLFNKQKQQCCSLRHTEAQFLVPDLGIKPITTWSCRTGPPAYVAWRAVTITRRHSRVHPSARDWEFGYRCNCPLQSTFRTMKTGSSLRGLVLHEVFSCLTLTSTTLLSCLVDIRLNVDGLCGQCFAGCCSAHNWFCKKKFNYKIGTFFRHDRFFHCNLQRASDYLQLDGSVWVARVRNWFFIDNLMFESHHPRVLSFPPTGPMYFGFCVLYPFYHQSPWQCLAPVNLSSLYS